MTWCYVQRSDSDSTHNTTKLTTPRIFRWADRIVRENMNHKSLKNRDFWALELNQDVIVRKRSS